MLISDWSSDVCSSDLGGYPVLPAMLAARKMGIATVIHEQNSVLGRVNRLLARKVDMIATAYADVKRLPSATLEKTVMVGNPVREEIRALREQPYPALSDAGLLRVLVVGGSQGATVLSDLVQDGVDRRRAGWGTGVSGGGRLGV